MGLAALAAQELHDERFRLPVDLRAIVTRAEGDPRVVDEDIEAAEALDRLLDQPVAVVRMRHARLDDDRLLALAVEFGEFRLGKPAGTSISA